MAQEWPLAVLCSLGAMAMNSFKSCEVHGSCSNGSCIRERTGSTQHFQFLRLCIYYPLSLRVHIETNPGNCCVPEGGLFCTDDRADVVVKAVGQIPRAGQTAPAAQHGAKASCHCRWRIALRRGNPEG